MAGKYWTDAWNFKIGCDPYGPVCDNCWASGMAQRWASKDKRLEPTVEDGKWTGESVVLEERIEYPRRWTKPRVVAVNWLGDLFKHDSPLGWTLTDNMRKAFRVMVECSRHQFLILTKRSDVMLQLFELFIEEKVDHRLSPHSLEVDEELHPWKWPPENIWWGISAWDQESWDEACETFDNMKYTSVFPVNTWISLEPQFEKVGPVNHALWECVDWIVQGSQTGSDPAGFDIDWARHIISCCDGTCPLWIKQTGSRVGRDREVDGKVYNEAPPPIAKILNERGQEADAWPECIVEREGS